MGSGGGGFGGVCITMEKTEIGQDLAVLNGSDCVCQLIRRVKRGRSV